jgi:hypothetical protein
MRAAEAENAVSGVPEHVATLPPMFRPELCPVRDDQEQDSGAYISGGAFPGSSSPRIFVGHAASVDIDRARRARRARVCGQLEERPHRRRWRMGR